jgi:sugar phosphate isomerase/epimerase
MTLEDFIDLASDIGIDGVELTSYYFPTTERDYLHSLKRRCLVRGIDVSGAAVGSKLTIASNDERSAEVRMVKEWLGHAVELGAPELRVFAGVTPDGHTDEDAFEWAVAALRECAPVAAEKGVVMALENHGGITRTSAQVIRLIDAVDSEWLRVNLDTGNYGMDPDVDPYEGMRRVAPLSVTAHHKVSMKTPDGKKPVDIERVVSTLNEAGYRGFLNIEYEDDEDPKKAVPRVVEDIRQALARLGKTPDWPMS